jgi:hypothetical protein
MIFLEGEIVILNEHAKKGLPQRIGERGVITMYHLKFIKLQIYFRV